MTLADRLNRMLDASPLLTVAEVARAAGMADMQVRRIFRGGNDNPGLRTVERLVTAMGGTLAELFADGDA